ncbi:hypothetical protein E4U03_04760 [Rothia nasimurium]|uniref:Uncharacterized protein n=1 Tax=Rothia nasimurium TaxID=85336 RepID=A0A4Y9F4I3_9MICC|nr:hypothetical protein [Rothia nasimurium]MBF0807929.1 hypothetical protein [Rothia nasimurium]TFU22930.1 hypothetical protein E4U03_04760 [Rothia nasimurium]
MKELVLAILAGICVYATLLACAIALEALGVWLYGWGNVGALYMLMLPVGLVPAGLTVWYVYEDVLS